MSELSKNVTSEWIKATAVFGHTPLRIPVQMYVEGDDDVMFWKEAVKPYQTKYDINVVTNKAVNPEQGNGKSMLLSMEGLGKEKVVAVDADFDLIVDEYSTYTNMVRNSPFVVNTTWHSVENILLQKTDYISLVELFSMASWELYTYYLATVVAKEEPRPIKHYGEMLSQFGVQKCACQKNYTKFETAYKAELNNAVESHKEVSAQIKEKLVQLGYNETNIWKVTRGHYLWDMIVKPQFVAGVVNKINQGIQGNPKSIGQVKNSMGITKDVRSYADEWFYNNDMNNINVPTETRAKLNSMFV
ncbi:hypothetical protein [Prevotella fusca]